MNREQNFTMRKNNNFTNTKATAFTIAEVLITLGIIGIVAAMTIPTLVKKYERYVLKKQFQTAYSLVSNAVQRMTIDNPNLMNTYCGRAVEGDANFGLTAPLEKRTKFAKDFSQYFKVIDDNFENPAEYFYRFKQPNYDQDTDTNGYNDGQFIINNGMMIANGYCWIGANNKLGKHVEFLVDTNGKKGPNALGYDAFYFYIDPQNRVTSSPQIPTSAEYCNFLTEDTTGGHNGVNCTYFALKDIFPQDQTKSYWDNLP